MTAEVSTPKPSNSNDNKMLMLILIWLFAPISSIFFMSDADDMIQFHAKQSLIWGLMSVILYVGLTILIITSCLVPIWALIDIIVRIYGIVQANNGVRWKIPVIGDLIK